MAKDGSGASGLDDLRRRAYGPPSSDSDATEALRELLRLEEVARSERPRPATTSASEPIDTQAKDRDDEPSASYPAGDERSPLPSADGDAPERVRHRPAWLIAVVVVVLLVVGGVGGYAVATTGSSDLSGPSAVTPTPSFTGFDPNRYTGSDGSDPTPTGYPGDLDAAKQWLAVPEKPSDALAPAIAGLGFQNARRVWHPFGTDSWNLWVALDSSGTDYCLIASGTTMMEVQYRCVTPDDFTAAGVSLDFDGNLIVWNGTLVSTRRG